MNDENLAFLLDFLILAEKDFLAINEALGRVEPAESYESGLRFDCYDEDRKKVEVVLTWKMCYPKTEDSEEIKFKGDKLHIK